MEDNINNVKGDGNTSVSGNDNQIFQELTNQINELKNKPYPKTIFFWLSGFSFLFSIIAVCGAFVHKNTVLENESIVLILVGILATFIVVGNYMQVKDIEGKFEKLISVQKNDFTTKIAELKEERMLFELKNNEVLSLMYLEIAKIYYNNQPKDNNYKYKLNYKENILRAIFWAAKTKNRSTCEDIDEFLSGIRIAIPKFYDKDILHISKIRQQIDFNKIKEIGNFEHIENLIFE
jgi:hypothetical protein